MTRVIEFRPVAQADFTNANQMFRTSIDEANAGITQALNTINNFDKFTKNRNEANLQNFINSIPMEELNDRQAEINAEIDRVAKLTGNQFDPKVIETYRDGRYETLRERATKDLVYKGSKQDYDAEQLALEVQKIRQETTPENQAANQQYIDSIFAKYDPATQALAKQKSEKMWYDTLATQGSIAEQEKKTTEYQAWKDLPSFEGDMSNLNQLSLVMGVMPSTITKEDGSTIPNPEYQAYAQRATEIQKRIQAKLEDPNLTDAQRAVYQSAFNDYVQKGSQQLRELRDKLEKQQFEKDKQEWKQYVDGENLKAQKDRIELQGKILEQNGAIAEAKLLLEGQRVENDTNKTDASVAKTLFDMQNGGSGSGSGGSGGGGKGKSDETDAVKSLDNMLGKGWVVDGQLNGKYITRNLIRTLDTYNNPENITEYKMSNEDYQKWQSEKLPEIKKIHSDRWRSNNMGFETLFEEVENYRHNGRPLTNWEKVQVFERVRSQPAYWFKDKDYIKEVVTNIDNQKAAHSENLKRQAFTDLLIGLEQANYDINDLIQSGELTANSELYKKYGKYMPDDLRASIENHFKFSVPEPTKASQAKSATPSVTQSTQKSVGKLFNQITGNSKPYPVNPANGTYTPTGVKQSQSPSVTELLKRRPTGLGSQPRPNPSWFAR